MEIHVCLMNIAHFLQLKKWMCYNLLGDSDEKSSDHFDGQKRFEFVVAGLGRYHDFHHAISDLFFNFLFV
jgi:hypothetical protein